MEESAGAASMAAVGNDDASVASSSAAAAAASGPAASIGGIEGANRAEDILGCIRNLKEQQAQLRTARKAVSKQLRKQSKRVSRIRKRARLLSDAD